MASKKIFIDPSVFYALVDRADPNHAVAARNLEQLAVQGSYLFTSIQAVQDAFTTINNQLGQTLSFEFIGAMMESNIEILCPQKSDLQSAFRLVRANRDKQLSLKEALIAILMQKKGISQIMTFGYWHSLLGTTKSLGT